MILEPLRRERLEVFDQLDAIQFGDEEFSVTQVKKRFPLVSFAKMPQNSLLFSLDSPQSESSSLECNRSMKNSCTHLEPTWNQKKTK